MVLSTDAADLLDEIRYAEVDRDNALGDYARTLEEYAGRGFRESNTRTSGALENHLFEVVAQEVPKYVSNSPRVTVKTARTGVQKQAATALEFAINRWIRETEIVKQEEMAAVDFSQRWAVLHVSREPKPSQPEGEKQPKYWPVMRRVSLQDFIWDYQAKTMDECRFFAHRIEIDKEDLIRQGEENPDQGWNVDEIKALYETPPSEMFESGTPNNWTRNKKQRDQGTTDRKRIEYYEIWIPEIELEKSKGPKKGYNGTIYTLGVGQTAKGEPTSKHLRDPRPFWGPRWGPYSVFGSYVVPDDPAPLSQTTAVSEQTDDLNAHARSVARSAGAYKKVVFVSNADPDLQQKVKEGEHQYVLPVNTEEIARNIAQVEFAGVTQTELAYLELSRQRLDRVSGLSDAMRGEATGQATATENKIAAAAGGTRSGFNALKFSRGMLRGIKTAAWYIFADDDFETELGPEAAGKLMNPETGEPIMVPWYAGGIETERGESFDDFDGYEFEIDLLSMDGPGSPEAQEASAVMDQNIMMAQMMPQMLWVDWDEVWKRRAEIQNDPHLAGMFDTKLARNVGAMMLQLQGEPPAAQGQVAPQPRMSQDMSSGIGGGTGGPLGPAPKSEAPSRALGRSSGNGSMGGVQTLGASQ